MDNKSPELEIAIRAALEAGKILEKYFEKEIIRETKDDGSVITKADTESEAVIKKIILDAFPKHSIIGEETGLTKNGEHYTWYIDPLDGTRNFSQGIPFFAVSIALVYQKEVIVGVVYNSLLDALFYAEKGKGAYWNDKKISVSKADVKHCIVTVASGRTLPDLKMRRNLMRDLPEQVVSAVRDFACTALDLSYVARGNTEADIKFGLKTYDFAAGILLVQEAGGKVTTLDGKPWKLEENSYIASNGVFHDVLVDEVKKQKIKLGVD